MKRREAIKLTGAALGLAAAPAWAMAHVLVRRQGGDRKLHALHAPWRAQERLPAFAWRIPMDDVTPAQHKRTFAIGLGHKAHEALARVNAGGTLPDGMGLFSNLHGAGPAVNENWLHTQLETCTVVMLVIDEADPRAIADAMYWSMHISMYDKVALRVAIVLTDDSAARQHGGSATLIAQRLDGLFCIGDDARAQQTHLAALLLDSLMLEDRSTVAVTVDNVREFLVWQANGVGSRIIDVSVLSGGIPHGPAVPLEASRLPQKVLAWLHASPGLTIGEFEHAMQTVSQRLGPTGEVCAGAIIRPEWIGSNKRVLFVASASDDPR